MNDNNENLMERYGITAKQSTVYMYLGTKVSNREIQVR